MKEKQAREYLKSVKGTEGLNGLRPEIMNRLRYEGYLEAIKKAEGLAKAVKLYLKLDKDGYPIGTDVNLEEALDKWKKEK